MGARGEGGQHQGAVDASCRGQGGGQSMPKFALRCCMAVAGHPAGACTAVAAAQSYPDQPIRLIIPFPPGGSNDIVGRAIATHLERAARQAGDRRQPHRRRRRVGTEPRQCAGGRLHAARHLARAHDQSLALQAALTIRSRRSRRSHHGVRANVTHCASGLPVHSVNELIALARAKPGELQYASAGVGTFQHLGAELFKLEAGIDLLHVPFRGGGPALIDVLGGHTKVMFSSLVHVCRMSSAAVCGRSAPAAAARAGAARRADDRRGRGPRL